MLSHTRDEIAGEHQEDHDPEGDHRRQPPVQLGDQRHGRSRVDDDEPDHLQQRDDQVARRLCAGPDLGNDPPGKVVLKEGERLPRDMDIGLPAHQVEEPRDDRLLLHECGKRHRKEAEHQDRKQHEEQFRPVGRNQSVPAVLRPDRIEHIDKPADEIEQAGFQHRHQTAEHGHGEERTFCLAGVKPGKTPERSRRLQPLARRKGVNPVLENLDDGAQHCSDIGGSEIRAIRFRCRAHYNCVTPDRWTRPAEAREAADYSAASSFSTSSAMKPPDWRDQRSA